MPHCCLQKNQINLTNSPTKDISKGKLLITFISIFWEKLDYEKFGVLIADILSGTLKHFFVPTDLIYFWTVHHEYSIGGNTKFLAGS